MTDLQPSSRGRSRRAERAQRFSVPQDPVGNVEKLPTEQPAAYEELPQDLAAYYSRDSETAGQTDQPAFAPPVRLQQYASGDTAFPQEEETVQNHIYRPLQATWAEQEREELQMQGYEVQAEKTGTPPKARNGWKVLLVLPILALLACAVWFFREPLMELAGMERLLEQSTPAPTAVPVTPEPVKPYDPAPAMAVSGTARSAIGQLSGTVDMETYIVTDQHIVTRNRRSNGTYDFYLFTAEGRLLCYFEGLGALDLIPQEGGSFYVKQEPYLVSAGGSALIRTDSLEAMLNEQLTLHPLYRGWAVVESDADGSRNYISRNGQLLSKLWFSRTFPFTGEHTMAYVDTGNTADAQQRYLLYILSEDGGMQRWLAAADMTDVIASACGMAYMKDGSLYALPDISTPAAKGGEAHAWLDCGAVAVRDGESGKYGLFVNGKQHYDFLYDSIRPVDSDITWAQTTLAGEGGSFTVHAVSGAAYPQPLSHSFVLAREDGENEYVALSTLSSYPFRLEDEF